MDERNKPVTRKVKGMRRTIARRMHESLSETAQLTLHTRLEIPELVAFKKENSVSYTDLFLKASAVALRDNPSLNATMIDNTINVYATVNIGVAVALDEGLMVPVIENVEQKTLEEIAKERKVLIEKTQTGQLSSEEVTSGTFTVSNLGMYPVDGFTPILNPPQVALLGIGRIQELPRVISGDIQNVPVVHLSLTIDHRAVDGAPGGEFLKELKNVLEDPERLRD
ncbi:dihydrolipoamide acetyltransferase family protein [Virgibacillus byunsanensis]|uniref:Dihydrolipoamide acetyltransferase family protein n=1 Tax=Virgibacillus byunsanensis TaxID=570945 RepID=A0ABW3LPH4_9BACI